MGSTVSTLQSTLGSSRDRLFASIRGLSEEQFRYDADRDGWCIATHLAHVLRIERLYAGRIRAALTEDTPAVASTRAVNDEDIGAAQRLAVPQVIHGMLNARREVEGLVGASDDVALGREIQHETRGRISVESMLRKLVDHENEHAAAIARIVKQAPASARVIIPLTQRS